jgi:hypothetical protein
MTRAAAQGFALSGGTLQARGALKLVVSYAQAVRERY